MQAQLVRQLALGAGRSQVGQPGQPALDGGPEGARQAARDGQHHAHQDQAIDQPVHAVAHAAEPAARQFGDGQDQKGAGDRAGHGAQAADQGEHGDLDREFQGKRRTGIHEGQVGDVERADDAGQHGRHDGGDDLHAHRMDAHGQRGVLAFPDGDQVMADARLADVPGHPGHQQEQAERDDHVVDLLAEHDPGPADVQRQADAAGSARPAFLMDDQQAHHLENGDGREREEGAAQAQRGVADQDGDRRRNRGARQHAEPRGNAEVLRQQRGGVAADAVEHSMAQGELAGVAAHDVPGHRQGREHEQQDEEIGPERRAHDDGHEEHHDQQNEADVSFGMSKIGKHVSLLVVLITRCRRRTGRSDARQGSRERSRNTRPLSGRERCRSRPACRRCR